MATIVVTPRAERDVEEAMANLSLPGDTWARIGRSLRLLEDFPRAGRELEREWSEARFVLGPWPWMILAYRYDKPTDKVFLLAAHDARSATSATAGRS